MSGRARRVTAATDYEVGYGKPPAAHRFQKGRSGNPRGRPPGRTKDGPASLEEIILAEANRTVKVNDGARTLSLPAAQAVVRSIAQRAAGGDAKAQQLFTRLLREAEQRRRKQTEELLEAAIIYKTEWSEEIERCGELRLPLPEPLPHPDDIEIDLRTGDVRIAGPMTPEEKTRWDAMRARKAAAAESIALLKTMLENARGRVRDLIEAEIAQEETIYKMVSSVIKD